MTTVTPTVTPTVPHVILLPTTAGDGMLAVKIGENMAYRYASGEIRLYSTREAAQQAIDNLHARAGFGNIARVAVAKHARTSRDTA